MKAFRMQGIGEGSVQTVDDPVLGEDELLVEPVVSGLCATDVHVYFEGALVRDLPLTMGHETVGRVIEARRSGDWSPYAENAQTVQVGDLVCVEPLLPCNQCHACLRGRQNLCSNMSHLGIWRDGCWADYVTVPSLRAVPVHGSLSPSQAVFVEPLACALHFLDRAGIGPGRSALIVGAGPAGLLTLQAAKASGASPLIVSDPADPRRRLAQDLGADLVVDPTEQDLDENIDDATAGLGCDVIIEVAGAPAAVQQAITIARPGSCVVLAGICGETHTEIDTNAIVTKELTIVGALASRWHFDRAMKLVVSGAVDTGPLVSRSTAWTDVEAMLHVAHKDLSVVKILLEHGGS